MKTNEAFLDEVSGKVIGCAIVVSNTLGAGFLEKVYENALAHELRKIVAQQHNVLVHYDDIIAGSYTAGLLVEQAVLVELEAVHALEGDPQAQCMNYPEASRLWLCLLLNFGNPRLEIKRLVNG